MRYRRGCVYVQGVVPPLWLSPRLHHILMVTTLVLGLSLVPVLAAAGPFREVVVFGDSLSDTGNVWAATQAVLAEAIPVSPPYFQGRFSNGPVWVERLAEQLGLPLRPFLQGGTNFAFGGAAIGFDRPDLFENDVRVLIPSLRTQVISFLVQHLFDKADPAALYMLWGGANDLRDALVTAPDPFVEARQAVEDLVAAIVDLAEARAVSFLVLNMPNLAWTPESRRRGPQAMAQANRGLGGLQRRLGDRAGCRRGQTSYHHHPAQCIHPLGSHHCGSRALWLAQCHGPLFGGRSVYRGYALSTA